MKYSQAKRSLAAAVLLLAAYGGGMLAQTDVKLTLVSGPGQDREEGAAMVCDGRLSTKWCIDSPRQMPYTLVLDAGTPSSFAEYGFVTGDDTETYPDRNPVTWRVSGSNDKQEWTVLDNQKNSRRLAAENWQEYRFRLAGKGAFRYYRFEFFRVAGGTRIQLSEITFHETVQSPLKVTLSQGLGRGYTWMDAGTFDSLQKATDFVSMIEQYQGMTISAPEEIAYHMGWIDVDQLSESAEKYGKSPYGDRLRAVAEGKVIL